MKITEKLQAYVNLEKILASWTCNHNVNFWLFVRINWKSRVQLLLTESNVLNYWMQYESKKSLSKLDYGWIRNVEWAVDRE